MRELGVSIDIISPTAFCLAQALPGLKPTGKLIRSDDVSNATQGCGEQHLYCGQRQTVGLLWAESGRIKYDSPGSRHSGRLVQRRFQFRHCASRAG